MSPYPHAAFIHSVLSWEKAGFHWDSKPELDQTIVIHELAISLSFYKLLTSD